MKKVLLTISTFVLILTSFVYCNIYYVTPSFIVKPEIQKFIDKEFNNEFKVVEVQKQYSPDLFHQPTGYSVTLEDKRGLRFGNIYVQNSFAQGEWRTYMGSDIREEYQKEKLRRIKKNSMK